MRNFMLPAVLGLCAVACSPKPDTSAPAPSTPASADNPPVSKKVETDEKPPQVDKANEQKSVNKDADKRLEPPRQLYNPDPPQKAGWKTSLYPAVELAKRVDARIATLKGASWYWRVFGEIPEGSLRGFGEGMVVSPSKFRYEFPVFGDKKDEYIMSQTWIADGRQVSLLSNQGVGEPKPVAAFNRIAGLDLMDEFPSRLGEVLLAPLGTNQRPFSSFVAAAAKPGSGYRVSTEEKTVLHEGKAVNNTRVLITRPLDKSKGRKGLELEVVVNSNYTLPVSARIVESLPNGQKRLHTWGAQWNLNKGQKFDEKKFRIPIKGPF